MGKYENTLKYIQLRKLVEEKDYIKALELAEELDQNRIRDISELRVIADVYRKNKQYEKAKGIYGVVYNEMPTRRNLFMYILLCIKSNSLNEAESLYQEYLTRDKYSVDKYILRYRIDKAVKAGRDVIIKDLEDIKREEYMEDWGYELAKQYHKAGMAEQCVKECYDLILWFSEGEIVEKAKLLKMHYDNNLSEDFLEHLQNSIGADISMYMNDEPEYVESEDISTDVSETSVYQEETAVNSEETAVYAEEVAMDSEETAVYAEEAAMDSEETAVYAEEVAMDSEETAVYAEEAAMDSEETAVYAEEAVMDSEETAVYAEEAVMDSEEMVVEDKHSLKYPLNIPCINIKELFVAINDGIVSPLNFALISSDANYAITVVKKLTKELERKEYFGDNKIKIAKIDAGKLNSLKLENQINELMGACVMIENASKMNAKAINGIIKAIDAYSNDMIFVFTDEEDPLAKTLYREEALQNKLKCIVLT